MPGGFTLDDFTVDETAGTPTCPAGQVRPMSKSRTVTFGAACADCPLRSKCTTAKDGRSMTIHPHEGLRRQTDSPRPGPHRGIHAGLPHPVSAGSGTHAVQTCRMMTAFKPLAAEPVPM